MPSQLQTAQYFTDKWLWNEYFTHETMCKSLNLRIRGGGAIPNHHIRQSGLVDSMSGHEA